MKMGMMASDREMLLHTSTKKLSDNVWLTITKSTERDDVPVGAGAVRMYFFTATKFEQVD